MIKGFKEFLLKNNVLALAVAVIVGGAVGKVVSALAADIIMPVISPLLPSGDFRKAQITIGSAELKWGDFLGSVVDFVIIAFIVYMITKAFIREAPAAPTKNCPRCREAIALEATKCKFCTADI
jgi:large conductance mechanosensitive channel